MVRHYSIKSFFRQMPNALLARYFHAKEVLNDFDFASLKTSKTDKLFKAWLALTDDQRKAMDAEIQDIFVMSCETGWLAIIDAAKAQLIDDDGHKAFVEKLATLASHYERAMVTFLDHNAFWKMATLYYHADEQSHWRKRKNLPREPAATDKANLDELAVLIRDYFRHTEGRGNNCVVEAYRRDKRDYFFAYPEDYSQQSVEWVDGVIDRRPHHPAFEVIYVYSQEDGTLDLNLRAANKVVEPLQAIFATAILKLPELPADPKDERVYDLNPLIDRDFQFNFDPDSGIERVAVKKLRLSSRVNRGDRITVEADASEDALAIYDLLETIGGSVSLNQYNVTQVELAASIAMEADKPAKSVAIRVTHPNSCSLKYDERDLRLRDMLMASGIEPKEPVKGDNE